MKKALFFLVAASALMAAGCNKHETPVESKGVPVRFTTTLTHFTVKSSFAVNDQIGIFAGAPISRINVPGTVNAAQGVDIASGQEIYWQASQTATTTFAACYPYQPGCDATAEHPFRFTYRIASDQATAAAFTASDLLTAVAGNVQVPVDPLSAEPVTLTFGHQFSKLVVNVAKSISAEIEDVEILDAKLSCQVDLENKSVSNLSTSGIIHAYRPDSNADVFEAIFLPGENLSPKIRVTVSGGATYTFSIAEPVTFAAGTQYSATVAIASVSSQGSALSFAVGNIEGWTTQSTPLTFGEPELDSHVWSVIGDVNGRAAWSEDFPFSQIENGVNPEDGKWEITISVAEGVDADGNGGSEFKIRWAAQWGDADSQVSSNNVVSIGMDPSWWYVDGKGENDEGLQLWQANAKNIKCKEAGTYKITLFYPSCKVYVEKQ